MSSFGCLQETASTWLSGSNATTDSNLLVSTSQYSARLEDNSQVPLNNGKEKKIETYHKGAETQSSSSKKNTNNLNPKGTTSNPRVQSKFRGVNEGRLVWQKHLQNRLKAKKSPGLKKSNEKQPEDAAYQRMESWNDTESSKRGSKERKGPRNLWSMVRKHGRKKKLSLAGV